MIQGPGCFPSPDNRFKFCVMVGVTVSASDRHAPLCMSVSVDYGRQDHHVVQH